MNDGKILTDAEVTCKLALIFTGQGANKNSSKKFMLPTVSVLKNPQYIFVRNKNDIQEKMTIEAVEKLFGIKWTEWDHNSVDMSSCNDFDIPQDSYEIFNKLELRHMSEQCGWGLFAKEKIYKGTMIGLFSGDAYEQSKQASIDSEHVFFDMFHDKAIVIDASRKGNITRFIQHLPGQQDIEQFQFECSTDDVAVENVISEVVTLKNSLRTIAFIATRDIENEIIGCPYAPEYWIEKEPKFFKKTGEIIPSMLYKKKNKNSLNA